MGFLPDVQEYISELCFTEEKRLLVEGETDRITFEQFFLLYRNDSERTYSLDSLQIDIADYIDTCSEFGNRGKVEKVCQEVYVSNQIPAHRFAGFVDREFREFNKVIVQDELDDHKNGHKVSGWLVWSRGHSAENYLFEPSLFIEVFCDILRAGWFVEKTIPIFRNVVEDAIQIACAIGLAASDMEKLAEVRKSVNSSLFEISSTTAKLQFNIDEWKTSLKKKITPTKANSTDANVELIIQNYEDYTKKLERADREVVRWICDGHLGFEIIIYAYCCCVRDAYSRVQQPNASGLRAENQSARKHSELRKLNTLTSAVLSLKENHHQCVNWWARKAKQNQCSYPIALLEILGMLENQ